MKENEKLIQEFFFKKKPASVAEKLKKKYGYEPQDTKGEPGEKGFGTLLSLNKNPKTGESFMSVTDPQEAGKRVVSALGASLGVNSVKNMASKSIKSFPIIISENVEPETSVMIKRVMEEQYAEYISLLVSNQIVDITAFKTSEEEGNIAIQALDVVSPEDEEKSLRRKIIKGEVSSEDILKNLNLTAYNLIRNEGKEYKTNNALLDALLEGAVIVPSTEAENLVEFFQNNTEGISILNELSDAEIKAVASEIERSNKTKEEGEKFTTLDKFILRNLKVDGSAESRKEIFDKLRGYDEDKTVKSQRYLDWSSENERLQNELAVVNAQLTMLTRNDLNLDALERLESDLKNLELDLTEITRRSATTGLEKIQKEKDIINKKYDIKVKDRAIDNIRSVIKNPSEYKKVVAALERDRDILAKKIENHTKTKPSEENETVGKYSRLTTTSILVDKDSLQKSLDSSLGELLLNENNKPIRERFEKATFLLQANRIAGLEYIEYVTQRLGMPIPKQVRQKLVVEYKIGDIEDPSAGLGAKISRKDIKTIQKNELKTTKTLKTFFALDPKVLLKSLTAGLLAGGGTAAAAITGLIAIPASLVVLGSAIVGLSAFSLSSMFLSLFKKKKLQSVSRKLAGWERVEALIDAMDEQRAAVRKISVVDRSEQFEKTASRFDNLEDRIALTQQELDSEMEKYHTYITGIAKTVKAPDESIRLEDLEYSDVNYEALLENAQEIFNLIEKDEHHKAALLEYQLLNEGKVQTTIPIDLELKYEYDPKKAPDILVAPKFATRSQYAYGSTEYDKRELKDRRYNAPLLMKINFKERFSDGKFSDNELTAVIGILGVITRVPSKEMEYILSSNAQGDTIKGIFEPDGDPAKLVTNILGIDKIKKDIQNLPQSSDVWQNLEKISRLAVSNKLSGRKDNNIANAHIIFAQKEIDNVRANENVDYLKNVKLVESLMKRYSAFTVMVANDVSERLYIFDNMSSTSWDVVPYSSFRNKDTGDQLNAMLNKMSSGRL